MFFTVCAVVSLDSFFSGLPPQHAYSNIELRLMPYVADKNAFQSNTAVPLHLETFCSVWDWFLCFAFACYSFCIDLIC